MLVVGVHQAETQPSRLPPPARVEAGEEAVIARRGGPPPPGSGAASLGESGDSAPRRGESP